MEKNLNNLVIKPYKQFCAYDHVYNIVKEWIASGTLKDGDRLPSEIELAEQIGIGRTAVREGLRELEAVGLITTVQGSKGGRFVHADSFGIVFKSFDLISELNKFDFDQLMEVRKINEGAAAELAALNHTEESLEVIYKALIDYEQSFTSKDEFVKANYNFHKAIALASKNMLLLIIIQSLRELVFRSYAPVTLIELDPAIPINSHRNIFQAIKERDGEKAKKMAINDLEVFKELYHFQQKTINGGE